MKQSKKLVIAILGLMLILSACGKPQSENDSVAEVPIVRVQEISERLVEQVSELTATVQPQVKNSIAPSNPGRIRNILVEVGQSVIKGQKLVQMDVANLSNAETQIENTKRIYKRVQELFNVGGASQQELDNAKLQVDIAETNLRILTENTSLLSPISGIITARNYDNGDMYSGQMPILTVMQINPVKLVINVSEAYYSQLKLGMPISIKIDVFKDQKFQGNVSLIYPTINEQTRTFTVEIKLNNVNNKVRPGMFARVILESGKVNRIVVPDQAVVKQLGSGARFVYVYDNGKVSYQQVELGRRLDNEFEILSGLTSGQQIVIAGQAKLVDGGKAKLAK